MAYIKSFLYSFIAILFSFILFINRFIDPSQTPKAHYFQVVSSLLVAVFSISSFLKAKNSMIKTNITDIAIILFFLYVFVQLCLIAPETLLSNGFINLFLLTVLYFIVKQYFVSAGKNNMLLFRAMAVILTAGCLTGLYQYIFLAKFKMQPFIIKGSFDNPGPYAIWMVSLLPVLLTAEALPKAFGRHRKKCYGIVGDKKTFAFLHPIGLYTIVKGLLLCLLFVILFLTQSRTAWLAAIIVVLLLLHKQFSFFKLNLYYPALFAIKP